MAWISYHTDVPATILETCLAMMQQFWGIMPQYDMPSPFASITIFLITIMLMLASGMWAGVRWLAM